MGRGMAGLLALLTALALLVAGCTTVPTSSGPQIVSAVNQNDVPSDPVPPPPADADPPNIVEYFLDQNADAVDLARSNGRNVLTTADWNPYPISIVDRVQVSNPDAVQGGENVTASGQLVGTLDENGVYTPSPTGDGTGFGSSTVTQRFTLNDVKTGKSGSRRWRITQPPKGTLLARTQFLTRYRERSLYFLNSIGADAGEQLVPDVRYSAISDPRDLAVFLVKQLALGTSKTGLQTEFPQQSGTQPVQVVFPSASAPSTTPLRVDIPSSKEINPKNTPESIDNVNRLAAQLATTLQQAFPLSQLEITDNGAPVRIPAVSGTTFTAADVMPRYEVAPPADATAYFVRDGLVRSKSGAVALDTGGAAIDSVAVQPDDTSDASDVAAVVGRVKARRLLVGIAPRLTEVKQFQGSAAAPLSRPSWQPGSNDAWVGADHDVWRVGLNGSAVKVPYQLNGQQVTAVRVSPDGARVALVLSANGAAQVYIGSIIGGPKPSIVDLTPAVSPRAVVVADVAWYDDVKLYAIGHSTGNPTDYSVYEFESDGSKWAPEFTQQDQVGLPGAPDSLTVTSGQSPIVAVGTTLWQQYTPKLWQPLFGGFSTTGTAPVFAE